MSISSTTAGNTYEADGLVDSFAYSFKILDEDDLLVQVRTAAGSLLDKEIGTHYTVTGVGLSSGGNVEFITAPADGSVVLIRRNMPFTQESVYPERGAIPSATLEGNLDKLTMMAQQLQVQVDRLQEDVGPGGAAVGLPAPVADRFLAWNSDEELINATGTSELSLLSKDDGTFYVGDGTTIVAETGATARASMGLGTISTQAASSVDIDGGAIDGVTLGTNSAVTNAQIDNVNINGNTITSTNTDGNLILDANGTGSVEINSPTTLNGAVSIVGTSVSLSNGATGPSEIRFLEDSDNGTNYVGLKAPTTVSSNVVYTLPSADGSTGHALVTDGAGALSFSSVGIVSGPSAITVFTASGTWTKPVGLVRAIVYTIGGGGGGAGGNTTHSGGGGGGGGSMKTILAASLGATETVTVGAGGVGTTNAPTAGGTTSFGAHCSATGGAAGALRAGGAGGTGSTGTINMSGGGGGISAVDTFSGTASTGAGGASAFGFGYGGRPANSGNVNGNAGTAYGGGGGAGGYTASNTGGAGAAGIVIVYEYT